MRGLIFTLLIPSLVAANVLCPNGKTTCPEDKYCCEVNGEQACCDHDAPTEVPDSKMKVYPGYEITRSNISIQTFSNESMAPANGPFDTCSFMNCKGPCCDTYSCCDSQLGTCCSTTRCCPSLQKCCSGGCCGFMQNCCGDGCCKDGGTCCGSYCCKRGHGCGKRHLSCTSGGVAFSAQIATVLVLVFGVLVSRHF